MIFFYWRWLLKTNIVFLLFWIFIMANNFNHKWLIIYCITINSSSWEFVRSTNSKWWLVKQSVPVNFLRLKERVKTTLSTFGVLINSINSIFYFVYNLYLLLYKEYNNSFNNKLKNQLSLPVYRSLKGFILKPVNRLLKYILYNKWH